MDMDTSNSNSVRIHKHTLACVQAQAQMCELQRVVSSYFIHKSHKGDLFVPNVWVTALGEVFRQIRPPSSGRWLVHCVEPDPITGFQIAATIERDYSLKWIINHRFDNLTRVKFRDRHPRRLPLFFCAKTLVCKIR